ncbi:lipase secretion chaperone [Moritella yayanosii]|uniref:Lipase chaperone n=1 Tax=Moritella yayanosii TaxID=69539 RepID=A0A330LWQ0_9GAMM|nr:lipase secretion chaperone [Moritella yayanosii]SQD80672.1 Lipase chaperone [Moritella yayanosii]
MPPKPKSFIVVTALSAVIAAAGGVQFLSQDDAQSIAATQAPTIEDSIIESKIIALQQVSYPLAPEAIAALVNQGDDVVTANTQQQQAVPLLLPSSLLGSTLPLTLDVNADGELVINKKIQHLFDFYLSAMGEESLDMIVARIKHRLKLQLVDPALRKGLSILTGYLQYLNAVTVIKQQFEQGIDPDDVGEYALENVIQVREMVLDARATYLDLDVIVAFFGQSDEYETYMLSVASINKNSELSTVEKQLAKAELDTTAPAWLLTQQHNANQLNQYREQYQTLQVQGASQTELQDFTQQSFLPEVVDRLAILDEKRQQWQIKLDEYRVQLAVITTRSAYYNSEANSDDSEQQREIAQLREVYFTSQEIKRVRVLDSIVSTSTTAL